MYTEAQAQRRKDSLKAQAQVAKLVTEIMHEVAGTKLRECGSGTDTSHLYFTSDGDTFEDIRVELRLRDTHGGRNGWGTFSNISVNIQTPYSHGVQGRVLTISKFDNATTVKLTKALTKQFTLSVEARTERMQMRAYEAKLAKDKRERLASVDAMLLHIAKKHLFLDTLETRNSDSLDFSSQSTAGIKAALKAAYAAGIKAAK